MCVCVCVCVCVCACAREREGVGARERVKVSIFCFTLTDFVLFLRLLGCMKRCGVCVRGMGWLRLVGSVKL